MIKTRVCAKVHPALPFRRIESAKASGDTKAQNQRSAVFRDARPSAVADSIDIVFDFPAQHKLAQPFRSNQPLRGWRIFLSTGPQGPTPPVTQQRRPPWLKGTKGQEGTAAHGQSQRRLDGCCAGQRRPGVWPLRGWLGCKLLSNLRWATSRITKAALQQG
jgi:hypothetical protein